MRISHRFKLIFFSNPKTGSSTVRHFIDPYCDVRPVRNVREVKADNPFHPHMRPEEARSRFAELGWDFGSYSRVVCVRNPWARLVSLYHHVARSETPPPFEDWLLTLTEDDTSDLRLWYRYGRMPLDQFIQDRDGNVLVDRVLRTEDIDELLILYLRSIGLPIPYGTVIPKRNHTGHGQRYQRFFSQASAELVGELFRYEILHFGYRFGDPA